MDTHRSNGRAHAHEEGLASPAAPRWERQFPGLDMARMELYTDQFGQGFVTIRENGRGLTLRLKSDAFRNWLICRFIDQGNRPGQGQIRDLIAALEALASRAMRELHNRSAWAEDRSGLYIDLADPAGRAVHVQPGRWEVIDGAPIGFRRLVHQERLPDPDRSGDLRGLLEFLPPLRSDGDRLLVLTWIVAALVPFARPVLMLIGDPGSGKTTAGRTLRRLVDPSKGDLLGQDSRADLLLTFAQHAVPVLDNIDGLSKKEADLLCRGVTGGAIARRRLYTDDDEVVRSFLRAIIITGLAPPTNRADLLDRSLILPLDRLAPERRRTLAGIEASFEAARARLFGGMLNTLSETLAGLPEIPDDGLSRMADFHRFGRAAAVPLGYTPEQFDAAMRDVEARQNRGAADNTLAAAALEFARREGHWVGDISALFGCLIETAKAHQIGRSREFWPDTALGLGRKIDLLTSALAEHGVTISRIRHARERLIQLEYNPTADTDHRGEE